MRAISLWQPWASAIALGAKKIETRSFRCQPGLLAIHASLKWTKSERLAAWELSEFCQKLSYPLPLGKILCVVRVTACTPTNVLLERGITSQERAFGNYSYSDDEPRFGWDLELVEVFSEPIPARGQPGFWDWKRPDAT